jgi:hypothetical protein
MDMQRKHVYEIYLWSNQQIPSLETDVIFIEM